jgi:hypothetical protein
VIPTSEITAEIYWTPTDPQDTDLIPGHLTRIVKAGRELRLFFTGRHTQYRDQYEGVLILQLRMGLQIARGTQSYKEFGGDWEPLRFSVAGTFQDDRCTSFSGTWTEGGSSFQVDVVGLPAQSKRGARSKKGMRARKQRAK